MVLLSGVRHFRSDAFAGPAFNHRSRALICVEPVLPDHLRATQGKSVISAFFVKKNLSACKVIKPLEDLFNEFPQFSREKLTFNFFLIYFRQKLFIINICCENINYFIR
jgi:hypothetical protein